MNTNKMLRIALRILLAIFFVWLIASQVKVDELSRAFDGTAAPWVVGGLAAFAGGYACRIERWGLMLIRDNPSLTWRHCAGPLLGSFAANNLLPFRAGDMLRAFAFNGRLGVSAGIVLATLFVERLLDLLMVLVLLGIALARFDLT